MEPYLKHAQRSLGIGLQILSPIGALSVLSFIFSYVGVALVRRWAEQHRVLDLPNERSSHSKLMPRGGGLAIVGVTLAGFISYCVGRGIWPWQWLASFGLGAGLVSFVGWLDDLHSLSTVVRFNAQIFGAIVVLVGVGWWESVYVPVAGALHVGRLGIPVTLLWLVGLANAYNFMDGIDGIAGTQGAIGGVGWAILGALSGAYGVAVLGALLAATCLGFLFHNWPPARIFMGDVGSGFLGFTFACLALIGGQKDPYLASAGAVLMWPFVFDTAFTFLRRLIRRENVFAAHRSHLYQRLVISGLSHRTVTLIYVFLDGLGMLFALLIIKNRAWADLTVSIVLPSACFGLWGLTVIRERRISQEQGLAKTI